MTGHRLNRGRRVFFLVGLTLLLWPLAAHAQKFYRDDPLEREPTPLPAVDPGSRNLSLLLEVVSAGFGAPGERHPPNGVIAAQSVNTLGEVMDSPWFVNRHGRVRMGLDALRRGAGNEHAPSTKGPWRAMLVRNQGTRPGMLFRDADEQLYLLVFDSREAPELASGADMISSRFFHALGYHVPESYLVYFTRDRLVEDTAANRTTSVGTFQELLPDDIDRFLGSVARRPDGSYRALATRVPPEVQTLIGPFQFYGTRTDDPNDIVPHEHRRDLRGLSVFAAWVNHTQINPLFTLDAVVAAQGQPLHIRHYLVDFMSTLGSGRFGPKQAWEGHDPMLWRGRMTANILGLGVYTPAWMRAKYPGLPAVGRFESEAFEPDAWTPLYELAPFANRLPDDTYWAAKQLMAFSDEDIRAIVGVAEYSDPAAEAWIVARLIERRDRIAATFLPRVLPLDNFVVEAGQLTFDDLAVARGLAKPRPYTLEWRTFDNDKSAAGAEPLGAGGPALPAAVADLPNNSYLVVRITSPGLDPGLTVLVYLRKETSGLRVVGIDRTWPGRTLVDPRVVDLPVRNRYAELEPDRQRLFDAYARELNARSGQTLSPEAQFRTLPLSEQTTFDAVTHALMHSQLTDENGRPLGRPLDLISSLERIAGQYAGRGGDQQFRLYVKLAPDAREKLQASREFARDHENTVYHVGYPHSFRLGQGVPSVQFSLSEDGLRADIDVDYRTSKAPQSLFNGHLTSSNSDVRAGDNAARHARRWNGFVDWWTSVFGSVRFQERPEVVDSPFEAAALRTPTPVPPNRPINASIPNVADAMQEFLTDWIVRRNYDEAAAFLAPDVLECVADSVDAAAGTSQADLRRAARRLLEDTAKKWAMKRNLTEAMTAVRPWSPSAHVLDHAFKEDFSVLEAPDELGALYECGATPPKRFEPSAEPHYGTYYGTLFQVTLPGEPGGAMVFAWRRVDGDWRVVAYRAIE